MKYRKVPKTGDKISTLGYGCMRFPGAIPSVNINEKKATKQLLLAIDKGINYFDTAWPYHAGNSEKFLGNFLNKYNLREDIYLATKLPHWITSTKKEMHDILNKQLSKLKTDYIDYYLVHNLNLEKWEKAKKNGVLEFLDEAKKSGKIKYTGFSFHGDSKNFHKIINDYNWEMCQIQYNYLDIENQAGLKGLKYAYDKNIAVFIMEPLRGGNLSKEFPKSIKKITKKSNKDYTPTEWALRWLYNHKEITCVLSGMTEKNHIIENCKIADTSDINNMSKKELNIIDEVRKKFLDLMEIDCTGCYYCMPCPYGVNIPGCFEYYNAKNIFNDITARVQYFSLNGIDHLASKCVDCKVCIDKCPQNINIPKELKKVDKDMEDMFGKIIKILYTIIMKK